MKLFCNAAFFLLVTCLAAQGQSIFEDFNGNTQPGSLEIVLPTVNSVAPHFQDDKVIFPGTDEGASRSYLHTVAKNFSDVDFVAEITIRGGIQNGFFGMGVGDADASQSFNSEPRANPHIYLLMDKDSPTNNGLIDDNGLGRVATPNVAGVGTHRVKLTWDASSQAARFFVDRNYDGNSFVPDFVSVTVNGSDNNFTNSTTSIFFGGSTGVEFDDFRVCFVPEPSSIIITAAFGCRCFFWRKLQRRRYSCCEARTFLSFVRRR